MRDLKALVEQLAEGKEWDGPDYAGRPSREIHSVVELGKHTDGVSAVELELSCHHDKDSKVYTARLQIFSSSTQGAFTCRSYALMDSTTGGRLDRIPTPRYSPKTLEAFWEVQISKLRDDPGILGLLNLDHNQQAA